MRRRRPGGRDGPSSHTDDVGYDVYALDRSGRKVHDKALTNDEAALRAVFTKLLTRGRVLAVVDQPAAIGALAIAVARDMGIAIAYLPGLTMRRIAGLQPGYSITSQDRRPRRLRHRRRRPISPHTRRRVGTDDETLADLGVLAGYDDDLAQQAARLTNRLRGALTHVHPALERLLARLFNRDGVIDLLAAAGTPTALTALGQAGITEVMRPHSPRLARTLPNQITTALAQQ